MRILRAQYDDEQGRLVLTPLTDAAELHLEAVAIPAGHAYGWALAKAINAFTDAYVNNWPAAEKEGVAAAIETLKPLNPVPDPAQDVEHDPETNVLRGCTNLIAEVASHDAVGAARIVEYLFNRFGPGRDP